MADIPRKVLSEYFQDRMEGRVLKSAVFLTFRFDPGFFEQEVLPVFLDVPLSHAAPLRLVQLDEAIQKHVDHIAVYYDRGGLDAGSESAKLDVRRIPVSWPTGFFHPKNVLLLVEDAEPDDDGEVAQSLLVGALSANLTRAGWWENVEVCHVEELRLDEKSRLRGDLLKLISRVKAASPPGEGHEALEAIRRFVVKVDERKHTTSEGVLHPRLYVGVEDEADARESVPDFLERLLRQDLKLNLEVISPYFDESAEARPLAELIERFAPREVRVLLPRGPDGAGLCKGAFYDGVRKLENTRWGKLPADLLKSGPSESAAPRHVHAKVYRFFCSSPHYEACFVGSVNLTTAAHSKEGNFETAFLIESVPKQAPDWWLSVDATRPSEFQEASEDDGLGNGLGLSLTVRYRWDSGVTDAFWDRPERSPVLRVEANGSPLFSLGPLKPREWTALGADMAGSLRQVLESTSFLMVAAEGEEFATILVQEEGMAHKPSILLNLTVADILRCWASLTPEQRAILLEERYQELSGMASALMPHVPLRSLDVTSIFDAFAGIFHAFGCLERSVLKALGEGREKEAVYLLFGKKYDSLPQLLKRVLDDEKEMDHVRRYVLLLCARQLVDRARAEASPAFRDSHRQEFKELDARIQKVDEVREAFTFDTPGDRQAFLDWFEQWFLRRAVAPEASRA